MAAAIDSPQTTGSAIPAKQTYIIPLMLVVALFFCIGFITSLNDVLVPHFKDLFHLSNVRALLVQFVFFGAYFIMSMPSGWIIGKTGSKAGIVWALAIIGCGLLLFLPASIVITYPLFMLALFVVGSGLALLQVAINPYIGALGSAETASSRLNLAGGFNSLATTIAPRIGAGLIFIAAGATTAQLAHSVRMPYMVLAGAALLMALLTAVVPLPELIGVQSGLESMDGSAWSFRHLRLGAAAIFVYVGAEVASGSLMINFLGQPSMGGMSHERAAHYVSLYWGGAMVGRFIGFGVLRKVSSANALKFVTTMAFLMVATAVFGHGPMVMWAIVSCGLFNSVMWPCIFPMAVSGLGRFTNQGSGILITMVVGGAIIPEIQGILADHYGYQRSYIAVLLCYAYLIYYAVSGHRNVQENTIPAALPPPEVV